MLVTVYQYETQEAGTPRHGSYRTRESILAQGGKVLEETARQVPGWEVTDNGLWKPDRNPLI